MPGQKPSPNGARPPDSLSVNDRQEPAKSGGITSSEVVAALIADRSPQSGWMSSEGKVIEPRSELWLAAAGMWVRADGSRASGWRRGDEYFAAHFGWLARLRIRQAIRWWAKRQLESAR